MDDTFLALPIFDKLLCKFCCQNGHVSKDCVTLRNHTCQITIIRGITQFNSTIKSHQSIKKISQSSVATTCGSKSETVLTISNLKLESLLRLFLQIGSPSTAFSITLGISWYFHSACCNHMTNDPSIFIMKMESSCLPNIQTADGSTIKMTHIGTTSMKDLSLPNTYFVPNLSLNLVFNSQLCNIRVDISFTSFDCHI